MQRALGRRLEHHEGAAAVADLTAGIVEHHAAAAGAAITLAGEAVAAGCRADDAGPRHGTQLEGHADGGEACRGVEVGAHRRAEREIGEHRERAEVAAAVRLHAMRTGLVRHPRVAARDLVERQLDEIPGEMKARGAVERNRAQHAPPYLVARAHLLRTSLLELLRFSPIAI